MQGLLTLYVTNPACFKNPEEFERNLRKVYDNRAMVHVFTHMLENGIMTLDVAANGDAFRKRMVKEYGFAQEIVDECFGIFSAFLKEIRREDEKGSLLSKINVGKEKRGMFRITGATVDKYCGFDEYVVVPYGVEEIGDWAFYNCAAVREIKLPDSVKKIGAWAFALCPKLERINIPDGVRSIGEKAFYWDEKLKSLSIPSSAKCGKDFFHGAVYPKEVMIKEIPGKS